MNSFETFWLIGKLLWAVGIGVLFYVLLCVLFRGWRLKRPLE